MVVDDETWYAYLSYSPSEKLPRPDKDPELVSKPPSPSYPAKARERMVRGEVLLQVVVELDGTTTVSRILKYLPYCNITAIENAARWRWKPATKDSKPVRASGIITVSFDIYRQE